MPNFEYYGGKTTVIFGDKYADQPIVMRFGA